MNNDLKLQDLIEENIAKTKAILDCLLAAWDSQIELDQDTIYKTIWSAHDYLREITEFEGGVSDINTEETT